MDGGERLADRARHGRGERGRQRLEQRHFEPALPAAGRHLGADEAGADDGDARALLELAAQAQTIVERAQDEDAGERRRRGRLARRRSRCDHEPVEAQPLAGLEHDGAPGEIEGSGGNAEAQVERERGERVGLAEGERRLVARTPQHLLRERGPGRTARATRRPPA